jgi:hypothetical protein
VTLVTKYSVFVFPCLCSRSLGALWELLNYFSLFDVATYNEWVAKDFCKKPVCVNHLRAGEHSNTGGFPSWESVLINFRFKEMDHLNWAPLVKQCDFMTQIKPIYTSWCEEYKEYMPSFLDWHFCGLLSIKSDLLWDIRSIQGYLLERNSKSYMREGG